MSGFIDLHCHYVPGVDDGVPDVAEGLSLCRELAALGYVRAVSTPHIRRGLFDNDAAGLQRAFASLQHAAREQPQGLPQLDLSAEHHFDSLFWELSETGGLLPYPGDKALLIEFAYEGFPVGVERQIFRLALLGYTPVLAHPERYKAVFKRSDTLEPLLRQGVCAQLDVMSLTGHYGRAPRKAAERLLDEGAYGVACSDAHRARDVPEVGKAIDLLIRRAGEQEAQRLLQDNPDRLLRGLPPR